MTLINELSCVLVLCDLDRRVCDTNMFIVTKICGMRELYHKRATVFKRAAAKVMHLGTIETNTSVFNQHNAEINHSFTFFVKMELTEKVKNLQKGNF